jgi:glycosyltransferase involved in cell wall biosynthesis
MDVSVIVPTYNRAASLDALLHDLTDQRGGPVLEVVVVDNGSVDETRHVGSDMRIATTRPFWKVVRVLHARNAGIAIARAPLLAFIDDDVRPRHDQWPDRVGVCRASVGTVSAAEFNRDGARSGRDG